MSPLEITLAGERGFIFFGEPADTFAFVPADCVGIDSDDTFTIDVVKYFQKRWAVRNMRLNRADAFGTRLFPDTKRPVIDQETPGLDGFLDRLRLSAGWAQGLAQIAPEILR